MGEGAKVQEDHVETETLAMRVAKQIISETESPKTGNATLSYAVSPHLMKSFKCRLNLCNKNQDEVTIFSCN